MREIKTQTLELLFSYLIPYTATNVFYISNKIEYNSFKSFKLQTQIGKLGFADEAHFIPEAATTLFLLHCALLLHEACICIVTLQAEILMTFPKAHSVKLCYVCNILSSLFVHITSVKHMKPMHHH